MTFLLYLYEGILLTSSILMNHRLSEWGEDGWEKNFRLCLVRGKENRKERKAYKLGEKNREGGEDLSLIVFGMGFLFSPLHIWR